MNDINIINAKIVSSESIVEGGIGIKDGKITAVYPAPLVPDGARETIDAEGLIVMPGMIDTHVHIRGGVLSHREDFVSGTRAAAAGGVTTIMEMPIANPPASTVADFRARRAEIEKAACVDFCMYAGGGADNLSEIESLAAEGAIAYKTFLMPPVPGREKEFFGLCSESEEALTAVMERVKKTGRLLACHSELNEYVSACTKREMDSGANGVKAWGRSRPKEAEIEAVRRVIRCAEKTGCKASVCHVSTPEAVELICSARDAGADVHGETCPQYLVYNDDNAEFAGVFARMKPPLRSPQTQRRLLQLYAEGKLEITGSDHAPYTRAEKLKAGDDIWRCFDGVPGLELSLRLLLNEVSAGNLTYGQLVRNTSENPAKLFGIDDRKGGIRPGADADLVFVRKLAEKELLDKSKLFTKARDSADMYTKTFFTHEIARTLVRGATVFCDGEFTGSTGYGLLIKPGESRKI